jgi:hypothetical protein
MREHGILRCVPAILTSIAFLLSKSLILCNRSGEHCRGAMLEVTAQESILVLDIAWGRKCSRASQQGSETLCFRQNIYGQLSERINFPFYADRSRRARSRLTLP